MKTFLRPLFKKIPVFIAFFLLAAACTNVQAQVNLKTIDGGNWNSKNIWQSDNLTGTIMCGSIFGTQVYGFGTLFTTETAVGADIINLNGDYIGTVQSIASNTQLTLAVTADQYVFFQACQERKIPGAQDTVLITNNDVTIPAGYAATCAALNIGISGTNSAERLIFSAATSSLDVNGDLTVFGPTGSNNREILVNAGTLNVDGNLSMGTGQTGNQNTRITKLTITTGNTTVAGNLVYNNIAGSSPAQTQIIMSGGAGTFSLGGNFTVNNGVGTLTPGTTSTFRFTGSNQVVPFLSAISYNNIVTTGSGSKTLTANTTIPGSVNINAGTTFNIGAYTLTLNGAVTGTGTITGSSASNLVIGGAAGTLKFTQTSAAERSLKNLTMNSGSSATLGSALDIYGTVTVTSAALHLAAQNLTLKSNAAGTARVAPITGTLDGATNVTVERYIANPQRAWHLLSAKAVTGAQTIKQAWQENGGAIVAGQGTLVTSNIYTASNGFDMVSNSASILIHDQTLPSWTSIPVSNTNSTILSSRQGYMLFVRGDRTCTPQNNTVTSTVLRTNGTLTQGNINATVATGTGYTLVGNPYASPIDFESIAATSHLDQNYFVWDPSLTGNYGVGGFRSVIRRSANHYDQTPQVLGGTTTNDPTIQFINSGQAVFLHATGGAATIGFTENSKTASVTVVNPFMNPISTVTDQQLIANLMVVNADNSSTLTDGIRVRFSDSYSATTGDDIIKMGNFGENLSSYREGKKLIVENRPFPASRDTIYLRTSNLGIKGYRFQVGTIDFVQPGTAAYLQDAWLGTSTKIDLSGAVNNFDFKVTADAASQSPDRFRIVFTASGPKPGGVKTNDMAAAISAAMATTTNSAITAEGKIIPSISVYPNPVVNKRANVQLTGMDIGLYSFRLISSMGQVVYSNQLMHAGGSVMQVLSLGNIAAGNYQLEITGPGNMKKMQSVQIAD